MSHEPHPRHPLNLPFFNNPWVCAAVLVVAGALQTLTLTPFNLWWLGPVSIALILLVTVHQRPTALFRSGWLVGVGLFASGVSWIYISISEHGNTGTAIAVVLMALFIAGVALFHGLAFWFWGKLAKQSPIRRLLLFPAIWVLGDWLRNWLLTGFPWLYLGTAHTDGPLAGLAPVLGVHGVTFMITLTGAAAYAIAWLLLTGHRRYAGLTLMAGLLPWIVGPILHQVSWTQLADEPVSVAAVQGNIPQQIKWDPEFQRKQMTTYLELSRDYWQKDLVIWPETAIPVPQDQAGELIHYIDGQLGEQSTLITGIPWYGYSADVEDYTFHNSIMATGNGEGMYHKQKLVPFGEYVPMAGVLRGIIGFFDLPMSNFTPGPEYQSPLQANGTRVMPYICYEVTYPDFVAFNARGAGLLLTVSNDAWFGDSIGPLQHLQMARMRALETGRYMLRATNNGVTAIIDNRGRIRERIPQFERAVLTGEAYSASGSTPYMQTGSWPVLTLAIILVVFVRERVIPKG